jgi:uncharacterized coiled-coil protein SlyX
MISQPLFPSRALEKHSHTQEITLHYLNHKFNILVEQGAGSLDQMTSDVRLLTPHLTYRVVS